MEAAGLIHYDQLTNTLSILELPDSYKFYFDIVEKGDISWSTYYIILSLSGLVICTVFRDLIGVAVSTSFLVTSFIHKMRTRKISH